MKKTLFILITALLLLSFGNCKKSHSTNAVVIDSMDSIVGQYVGTVHYIYTSWYVVDTPYTFAIDTTFSITYVVSKSSSGVFATSESPSFYAVDGTFKYSSTNAYDLLWYYSSYSSGGELQFFPSSDSVSYSVKAMDQEGGGSVYYATWTRTFGGIKK